MMFGALSRVRGRTAGAAIAGLTLAACVATAVLIHETFVQNRNRAQLVEMSAQLLHRAELAIDYALITLGEAGIGGSSRCDAATRQHVADIILKRGAVKDIRVLSATGEVVCAAAGPDSALALPSTELLPSRNPSISLSAAGDEGSGLIHVEWRQGDGSRLVATINVDTLMFDLFPPDLRDQSEAVLSVGGGVVARYTPAIGLLQEETPFSFPSASTRFPLASVLHVRSTALAGWNRGAQPYAALLGGLIGLLAGMVAYRQVAAPPSPESELRQALESGQIRPFFQPIFNLDDKLIIGCEMLARWPRPDGSFNPPDRFIPIAEASGLIGALTRTLLRESLLQLKVPLSGPAGFKLAVNVDQEQFLKDGFLEDFTDIVRAAGVSCQQVVIELTERQSFKDSSRVVKVAGDARLLGFRIALDDTGSGHNGLAQVQELPLDIIKIDKKFVDMIETDAAAEAIVRMLVGLASELGITTLAEGIESDAQRLKLLECGVTQGQGYLVAPALDGPAFTTLAEQSPQGVVPTSKL